MGAGSAAGSTSYSSRANGPAARADNSRSRSGPNTRGSSGAPAATVAGAIERQMRSRAPASRN